MFSQEGVLKSHGSGSGSGSWSGSGSGRLVIFQDGNVDVIVFF